MSRVTPAPLRILHFWLRTSQTVTSYRLRALYRRRVRYKDAAMNTVLVIVEIGLLLAVVFAYGKH